MGKGGEGKEFTLLLTLQLRRSGSGTDKTIKIYFHVPLDGHLQDRRCIWETGFLAYTKQGFTCQW
jgi:hypothetical protein